jgi:hypothetical protein
MAMFSRLEHCQKHLDLVARFCVHHREVCSVHPFQSHFCEQNVYCQAGLTVRLDSHANSVYIRIK